MFKRNKQSLQIINSLPRSAEFGPGLTNYFPPAHYRTNMTGFGSISGSANYPPPSEIQLVTMFYPTPQPVTTPVGSPNVTQFILVGQKSSSSDFS